MSEIKDLQNLYEECIGMAYNCEIMFANNPECLFYDHDNNFGCSTGDKIYIDRALYMLHDDMGNKGTILHELCHSYAGVSNGHGKYWQEACDRITEKYPEYDLRKEGRVDIIISMKADELREKLRQEDPLFVEL